MDYENFKESFTEALQEDLYGKGIEARFDMKSVEKLNNEGYDAVTVTPADSNIGVTLNVEAFYKAHEDGASMDEVVSKASDTVIRGFDNQPSIDVASLMDYEQMKDKLIMEVVSTEANADMLANVPHRTFRVELLIKDVEKLIAKIRTSGCSSPRLNPLSFNAHFTHVFTNSAFSNGFAGFTKFLGYFRGAVILFRIIIDGLDFLFHSFLALLGSRDCSVKKRTISRARHT